MFKTKFANYLSQGQSPDAALQNAAQHTAERVNSLINTGTSANEALSRVGIVVRQEALGLDLDRLLRSEVEVLKVIIDPEITAIPTASCMSAHLPRDRKPTLDEIDKAWAACTSK